MKKLALGIVVLLIIIAVSCEGDNDIVLTFDGTECKVSGPSEIGTGDQIIVVKNLSGRPGTIEIDRLATETGVTWQDNLDYFGEPGSEHQVVTAPWLQLVKSRSMVSSEEDEEVWDYRFTLEGLYQIEWITLGSFPSKIWICAPLEVKEAAVG